MGPFELLAFISTVGAGTVTETLSEGPVPPGPEHWIVQVLLELIAPVDWEPPSILFEPDQALEAVHESTTPLTIQDNVFDAP